MNDYVAGYHDSALLFGKVLRERILGQRKAFDVPLGDNPFGNASFYGAWNDWEKNYYNEIFETFFCLCFSLFLCLSHRYGRTLCT